MSPAALHAVPSRGPEHAPRLRSAPVREILGRPPHWTLRCGIALIAGFVLLLLALAAYSRYPDVIVGRATVWRSVPPLEHPVTVSARLLELPVPEGGHVTTGDLLARLESDADDRAVAALAAWLAALPDLLGEPLPQDIRPPAGNLRLGDMQQPYADFRRLFDEHLAERRLAPLRIETAALDTERRQTRRLLEARVIQRRELEREIALLRTSRARVAELARDGLVARDALTLGDGEIARAAGNRARVSAEIATGRIELARLERQRIQLELEHARRARERLIALDASRRVLVGRLDDWRAHYRITARRAGVVTYPVPRQVDMQLVAGDTLLTLLPDAEHGTADTERTHRVHLEVPSAGAGRIRIGDAVRIRLDAWPQDEFGELLATVSRIAPLPGEGGFRLDARLEAGLRTAAGREIGDAALLHGEAHVVVRERGLLERLYRHLSG